MKVGVVGLGKLGLPLAALLAARGNSVVGVDSSEKTVIGLSHLLTGLDSHGQAPVITEPGVQQFVVQKREHLHFTTFFSELEDCRVIFIVVPTPSEPDKLFDATHVLTAIRNVGAYVGEGWRTIVVVSTLTPGTMDAEIVPALEKVSGRKVGVHIGLCYSPEFVALGSVVHGMVNPDLLLIGESDDNAGEDCARLLTRITQGALIPTYRTNFINAEIAKLSLNAYVTMKITYSNMISELCENTPGADAAEVLDVVGADPRVGHRYLNVGLGFGGPCFPRDVVALDAVIRRATGSGAGLLLSGVTITNRLQTYRLMHVLESLPRPVGVLGMGYKPGTPVTDESPGVLLASELGDDQCMTYDHLLESDSLWEVRACPTLVLMTNDPQWCEVVRGRSPGQWVVDPWRLLPAGPHVVHLGIGPRP